jgi:hypothetical protein
LTKSSEGRPGTALTALIPLPNHRLNGRLYMLMDMRSYLNFVLSHTSGDFSPREDFLYADGHPFLIRFPIKQVFKCVGISFPGLDCGREIVWSLYVFERTDISCCLTRSPGLLGFNVLRRGGIKFLNQFLTAAGEGPHIGFCAEAAQLAPLAQVGSVAAPDSTCTPVMGRFGEYTHTTNCESGSSR